MVDNMNERPSLYYNKSAVGNRISLQLIGLKSNQAALGAVVTLQQGNDKDEREVHSGDGLHLTQQPATTFRLRKI